MIHALIILLLQVATPNLQIQQPQSLNLQINGKEILSIQTHGEIRIKEGITMTEASRAFWKVVSQQWPYMCQCPNDPFKSPLPMYTPTMTPYPFSVGGG